VGGVGHFGANNLDASAALEGHGVIVARELRKRHNIRELQDNTKVNATRLVVIFTSTDGCTRADGLEINKVQRHCAVMVCCEQRLHAKDMSLPWLFLELITN
jgi:hypothetical protein